MVAALVDSSVLVDLLRGYNPAVQWIQLQSDLAVTRIVHLELIAGAQNKAKQRVALQLLNDFSVEDMIEDDLRWAVKQLTKYRLSHNVGILDCLIAAPSHRLQLPLYTRNLKHFAPLLGNRAAAVLIRTKYARRRYFSSRVSQSVRLCCGGNGRNIATCGVQSQYPRAPGF